MRDRLIEIVKESLVKNIDYTHRLAESITDDLLANGVIVPPCKVGEMVFFYCCVCDEVGKEKFDILEGEAISFSIQKEGLWAYCRYKCGLTYWHVVEEDFGKTVFLTREDAEQALKEAQDDKQ